jgi:DNA-binding IclR family transcriptional regulator
MAGDRRGMQVEISQYRPGIACAAVVVRSDRDPERRVVVACTMAADRLIDSVHDVRGHLMATARTLASALNDAGGFAAV